MQYLKDVGASQAPIDAQSRSTTAASNSCLGMGERRTEEGRYKEGNVDARFNARIQICFSNCPSNVWVAQPSHNNISSINRYITASIVESPRSVPRGVGAWRTRPCTVRCPWTSTQVELEASSQVHCLASDDTMILLCLVKGVMGLASSLLRNQLVTASSYVRYSSRACCYPGNR